MARTADLVPTLDLIKRPVEAGELDVRIAAAADKLRDGFGRLFYKVAPLVALHMITKDLLG